MGKIGKTGIQRGKKIGPHPPRIHALSCGSAFSSNGEVSKNPRTWCPPRLLATGMIYGAVKKSCCTFCSKAARRGQTARKRTQVNRAWSELSALLSERQARFHRR